MDTNAIQPNLSLSYSSFPFILYVGEKTNGDVDNIDIEARLTFEGDGDLVTQCVLFCEGGVCDVRPYGEKWIGDYSPIQSIAWIFPPPPKKKRMKKFGKIQSCKKVKAT
ncbi:MAG: hypothetical protein LBJ67_01090 [Planctomycetaceae bacterium]|jgi:hypothetical protein|nr:hypothetical protein [Planctomycetaceae bacterium]